MVTQTIKMTEFIPPIKNRETIELIEIANCTDENIWQREATRQAKAELIKRGISQEDQNKIIEEWQVELDKLLIVEAERLEQNKTESYTVAEMLQLFIFGPFIFMGQFSTDHYTLFNLRSENFFLKFKQRIIIFILSFMAWFLFVKYSSDQSQKKRQAEIDSIDISEWKKLHGYE